MSARVHRCRACAADVPDGAPRCGRCNAPQGFLEPCPHCRGEGGTSPHPELRFTCDLCGGPRVPKLDPSIPTSGNELPLLRKADEARKARATWRGAAVASGIALVLTVVPFTLLLIMVGAVLLLMLPGLLFTALFTGLLVMALLRASARGSEIEPALDGAWLAVATDIAHASAAPITAEELSAKLGIEEPQAEELVALIDVNETVGVVSVRSQRMRVSAEATPAPEPPRARTEVAEAEAAETEAAAEEATLGEDASTRDKL